MSYRELRNFTEIMRALGYPRLISMENFRRPNFELVADILYWMVKLYDPDTTISDRVELENDRVEFLTGIATLLAIKARIKLNTKKLYASDGRAVQELLKLATLLYRAARSMIKSDQQDEVGPQPIKVQDVKTARSLASDITQSGAKLFDLLGAEATNRADRMQAMRFLDLAGSSVKGSGEHAYIERSVRELITQSEKAVENVKKECEELEADEKSTKAKILKKQEELERTEKRLRSLENVRPQFMDEVDKLEKELQHQYEIYMEKYRNLDYLENELEQYYKNEEERRFEQERRLKKMRERLLREEVEILRGGAHREDGDDDLPVVRSAAGGGGPGKGDYGAGGRGAQNGNGGGKSRGSSKPVAKSLVQGSMRGNEDEDSESDGELSGDDDDDESLSVGGSRNGGPRKRGGGGGSDQDSNSEFLEDGDDDDDDEDDDDDDDMGDDMGSADDF